MSRIVIASLVGATVFMPSAHAYPPHLEGFTPDMSPVEFLRDREQFRELGELSASKRVLTLGGVEFGKPTYIEKFSTATSVGVIRFPFDRAHFDKALVALRVVYPTITCDASKLDFGMFCHFQDVDGAIMLIEHDQDSFSSYCLISRDAIEALLPRNQKPQTALVGTSSNISVDPASPIGKQYWINERFSGSESVEFFKSNGERVHFADSVSFVVLKMDKSNPSGSAYDVKVDAAFGPYFLFILESEFRRDLFGKQVVSGSNEYLAWRRRQYIFTGPPNEILAPIERAWAAKHTAAAVPPAASRALTSTAEDLVRKQLRDPGSAQFRNIAIRQPDSVALSVVCGEVNAKNSLGGYAGFTPFFYDSNVGTASILSVNPNSDDPYDALTAERDALEKYQIYCK